MKSEVKSYAGYGAGILLALLAMAIYFIYQSNQLNEKHQDDMNQAKIRADYIYESDATDKVKTRERERQYYADDVTVWTLKLQGMPKTQARTNFATSIIKATDDGYITDAEYDSLKTEFDSLKAANKVAGIKKQAAEIIAESPT